MLTTSLEMWSFLAFVTVGLAGTGCAAEAGPETPVVVEKAPAGSFRPNLVHPVVVEAEAEDDSDDVSWKLHVIVATER